jgi:RimJ/RimL family protein N-acetyltransferase
MKSLTDIRIQMDFELSLELAQLYEQATHAAFLGYNEPLSLDQARQKLCQYAATKRYGRYERLAIMKIWKGIELIGFCFPRQVFVNEYHNFNLEINNLDWYRLGTIYIDKVHRGVGVVAEVVKLFREQYPNLVWECHHENISSCKAAEKAGLKYSHHYFDPDEIRFEVFKSTGDN